MLDMWSEIFMMLWWLSSLKSFVYSVVSIEMSAVLALDVQERRAQNVSGKLGNMPSVPCIHFLITHSSFAVGAFYVLCRSGLTEALARCRQDSVMSALSHNTQPGSLPGPGFCGSFYSSLFTETLQSDTHLWERSQYPPPRTFHQWKCLSFLLLL